MQIIYLTETDKAQAAGLPWKNVNAARWDYRNRHKRGTAKASVRIGHRVGVSPDLYHQAIRQDAAAA